MVYLIIVSVKPGPDLSRSKLGMVRFVTMSSKLVKLVSDQVKDQVGQARPDPYY